MHLLSDVVWGFQVDGQHFGDVQGWQHSLLMPRMVTFIRKPRPSLRRAEDV